VLTGGAATQQGYVLVSYCNATIRLVYSTSAGGHIAEAIVRPTVPAMNAGISFLDSCGVFKDALLSILAVGHVTGYGSSAARRVWRVFFGVPQLVPWMVLSGEIRTRIS
jgi:hypothetical protein